MTIKPTSDPVAVTGADFEILDGANSHCFDHRICVKGTETCIAFSDDPWSERIVAALNTRIAAQPEREAVSEEAAQRIFEHFEFGVWAPGEKPAWLPNGNSDMQHLARAFAREALAALTTPAPAVSTDEIVAVLGELVDAMIRYEMDVDADAPARHRDMMERAVAILARLGEGGMTNESMVTQADREAAAPFGGLIEQEIRDGLHDGHPFVQALARHRTAAQPEREAVLEEAAMIVDQFASGRRYCEPTEWDYGAQDALVVSAKTIRALKATPAPAVSTDEIVAVLEWYGEQARLARLIHSEGDAGRVALAADGGKKARAILSRIRGEGE